MKDTEIEIQVKVGKIGRLVVFLNKNGQFLFQKHQIDEYFTPKYRDFTSIRPISEWLRLRKAGNQALITYKKWHHGQGGKSHYCDEFETEIKSQGQLKKILKALDLKSLVVVEKTRRAWAYQNYEISLDNVKGLGKFVEIEYIGKSHKVKPKKITQEMIKFLKKIDCGKIERNFVGYPFQLLFPNEVKHEKQ